MATHKAMSVADANRLVPDLRKVFERITELKQEITTRANELERMGFNPAMGNFETVPEDVVERNRIIELRRSDFQKEIEKIEEMGGILKDPELEIVDIPARVDGKDVLLCWQNGEDTIAHYHDVDADFADRRPLPSA